MDIQQQEDKLYKASAYTDVTTSLNKLYNYYGLYKKIVSNKPENMFISFTNTGGLFNLHSEDSNTNYIDTIMSALPEYKYTTVHIATRGEDGYYSTILFVWQTTRTEINMYKAVLDVQLHNNLDTSATVAILDNLTNKELTWTSSQPCISALSL